MLGFEPVSTEPFCSHYRVSGLFALTTRALRVRLRSLGRRLRVTVWRMGTRG